MTAKIQDLKNPTFTPEAGPSLTTDHGTRVSDTDNWLKVASDSAGPSLLEDHIAREKIHRFDHERIPERVVHARGAAAHGHFRVLNDAAKKYTYAPVLTDPSRETPVFVRFSTVQGSRGSADTVRDVRGFAMKFYTEEGNWDLVGNDIPVFFIQDAMKFPDFVHAVKPEPHNEVPQGQSAHNNFWDFVGLQPESAHMVMWVMSDRGIPRSYRMMQGFGVNTYTLLNSAGERHFVKFHLIPELGVHSLMWDEALKIAGQDPDFHRKDLEEAIKSGCPARWNFGIQTIPESREHEFEFDILDATKVWPEQLVPLEIIGEMVLDRTVDEYFPETEQVAFCTSHVVPGIGFSDDPLLQGRNFSYFDTQISRLGLNWEQLPINRPVCPMMNHNRDGQHQSRITKSNVNYWPNRHGVGAPVPPKQGGYVEYPQKVSGIKQRVRGPKFQEHFSQAQLFYNSLSPHEKAHLIDAISFELSHCDDLTVPETYMTLLNKIDYELAATVAKNVGASLPEAPSAVNKGQASPQLSQLYYAPKRPTIASRRVAILIADKFDISDVNHVSESLKSAGAVPFLIGPRRGTVVSSSGETVKTDHHFEGQRSTLFDALFIPSGEHIDTLRQNGRVVHWVREAFGHCKVIAAVGAAPTFVQEALGLPTSYPDEGWLKLNTQPSSADVISSYGVVTTGRLHKTVVENLKEKIGIDKSFVGVFAEEASKHRCYERELDGLTKSVAF